MRPLGGKRHRTGAALLAVLLAVGGCEKFFDISSPDVIEADRVHRPEDAAMVANSAFQNLATAYTLLALYGGWWAHEALVGDSDPGRNDFGLRRVEDHTVQSRQVWATLALAASTGEHARHSLREAPAFHRALAAFTAGYALVLMAEHYCEGTLAPAPSVPGPRMTTAELLGGAAARLEEAQTLLASTPAPEAVEIRTAARVGLARAHLAAGDPALAAAAARQVPAEFEMVLRYVDMPQFRQRLGNAVWDITSSRGSLVVPPAYRAAADAGDPRIAYQDERRRAQDSELHLYSQRKYRGYDAPMRLASGLEARYLSAEADAATTGRLALVNERRAFAGEPPLPATVAPRDLLAELLRQRSFDFWLEAKKAGDLRRHGSLVPFVAAEGETHYKPRLGTVGGQRCWPVPDTETRNNPHWR